MPNNLEKAAKDCLEKCKESKGMPESHRSFDRFLYLIDGYRSFFGGGVFDQRAVIESV